MTDREVIIECLKKTLDKCTFSKYQLEAFSFEGEIKPYSEYYDYNMYSRTWFFRHDFAKAFWGEERLSLGHTTPAWKTHLQQMVMEENPIDYLRKFIEK